MATRRAVAPVAAVVLLAVLALLPAACGPGGQGSAPAFPVGYRDVASAAPLLMASARHVPVGGKYRISARRYPSEPRLLRALASGEVSMAILPLVSVARMFLDRAPVAVVGATAESYGRDGIVATGGTASLDGVVGQRVAVSSQSSAFFLWTMLSRAGMDPFSTPVDEKPYEQTARALESGYSAAVLSGPALFEASRTAGRTVIMTTRDFPGVIVDVVVVSRHYAKAHPDVVQAAVRALSAAGRDLIRDPTATAILVARESSSTPDKVRASQRGLRYLDKQKVTDLLGVVGAPGALDEVAQDAVQFAAQGGSSQAPRDTTGFIDSRYINPAKQ